MTMKETERKAMEAIRKIVNGLGENSYIGSAMEGVWEIMEENIDNDFACSMGYRLEEKEATINGLKARLAKAESDLKASKDNETKLAFAKGMAETAEENANKLVENLRDALKESAVKVNDLVRELDAANDRIAGKEEEIVHLKAKLYDMMVKEG